MTALHVALGVALVAVNLAAGLLGAYKWHRDEYSRTFWVLLRAGQALVVLQAAQGGLLLLLGVAFIAEQLRAMSAQTILDQLGVESARELAPAAQEAAALDILRREMGVMAVSALVVAALGLRAGGVL